MEIVKEGRIPSDFWYGKCENCKTIFKSSTKELEEISNKQGGDYLSNYEYSYKTICYYCNREDKTVIFYSESSRSGGIFYGESSRSGGDLVSMLD